MVLQKKITLWWVGLGHGCIMTRTQLCYGRDIYKGYGGEGIHQGSFRRRNQDRGHDQDTGQLVCKGSGLDWPPWAQGSGARDCSTNCGGTDGRHPGLRGWPSSGILPWMKACVPGQAQHNPSMVLGPSSSHTGMHPAQKFHPTIANKPLAPVTPALYSISPKSFQKRVDLPFSLPNINSVTMTITNLYRKGFPGIKI